MKSTPGEHRRPVMVEASMLPRVCRAVAITVGVLLSVIGVLLLSPAMALTGVALGVIVGAAVALNVGEAATGHTGRVVPTTAARRAGALRAGGFTIAGWLVITGTMMLLGPVSGIAIMAMLLAAALPRLWRRLGTPVRKPPLAVAGHRDKPMPAERPAVAPEQLTTPQLCVAWQRSYFALLDLPTGPAYWEVVKAREGLLDELERRDPAGFTRWLETSARAGSDPGRYLAAGR